jgi:prepilin-type N-terminal cleavage/methylation domain-containing protein
MIRRDSRGFTLIELLVVIAIIGILSSVVLASLNSARQKGTAAKIKSELAGLRAAAEIYYDNNTSSYNNLFTSNTTCVSTDTSVNQYLSSITTAAGGAANVSCNSAAAAYAAAAAMPSGGFWCVDSAGVSRDRTGAGVAYTSLATAKTGTACN